MKILLLYLISYAESTIGVLQNMSQTYYLLKEEYASLYLNQYFSGDSLNYSIKANISSKAPLSLTNSFTNVTKLPNSESNIDSPTRNTIIQPLCQFYERYCETVFYCSEYELIVFTFDPINGFNQIEYTISFTDPIHHYTLVRENENYIIFVVTRIEELGINQFYNASFSYDTNGNLLFNGHSVVNLSNFMNELKINDLCPLFNSLKVAFAGFHGEYGYVVSINLVDLGETNIIPISLIHLSNKILLAANEEFYYALIQSENKIIKLAFTENTTISVRDSIYIPELNKQAFTFSFTHSLINFSGEENLLIGSVSKALIISIDFSQLYIKNLTTGQSEVYCISTNSNYFFLVNKNKDFTIHFIQDNFAEQFYYDLNISNITSIAWLASSYYNQDYFIIILEDSTLDFFSIRNEPAHLNFSCGEIIIDYLLTISDRFGNSLMSSFSVYPIFEMDKSIPIANSNPLIVSFDDLKANVIFSITDYFGGSNLHNIYLFINESIIQDNFAYSLQKNDVFSSTKIVNLDQHLYKKVLITSNGSILYNSSTVQFNLVNSTYNISFTGVNILDIQYDYVSEYYMIYCNDSHFGVSFFATIEENLNCPNNLNSSCLHVRSFFPYIGCNVKQSILIFEYIDRISIHITRTQNFTNNSELIQDFYITNGYIFAITSSGFILMYDLDSISLLKPLTPIMEKFVGLTPKMLLADESYFYIYFDSGFIKVYDSLLNYIKTTVLINAIKFVASDHWLFSVSDDSFIKIMNLQGYLISSDVFSEYTEGIIDFDARNTYFIVLKENEMIIREINYNFNQMSIDFIIKNNSNISELSFRFNASLIHYQNTLFDVNNTMVLILMINGQTIFLNTSEVNMIDKHLKLDCDDSVRIRLDQVFLGQNIDVKSPDSNNLVTIQPRLKNYFNDSHDYNISNVIFIEDAEIYIITVYPNFIFLIDNLFEKVLMNKTVTEKDYFCQVLSVAAVYVDEAIEFVVGVECLYQGPNPETLIEYQLFFIEFIRTDYTEILGTSRHSLNIKPTLIKTSLMISGRFVLIITTSYSNIELLDFFSNMVVLCSGSLKNGSISIFCLDHLTPAHFGHSSMYIVDMDIVFYPLLKFYYIYLLELSGSLFIIECSEEIVLINVSKFLLSNINPDYPVSIARCGQYLYIAYNSNLVFVYFLLNFKNPVYDKAIGPFGIGFSAIPGSLKCSNQDFAKYLLFTMLKNNICCYLQVIDTTANELASIINQLNFSGNTDEYSLVIFSVFSSSEFLTIITPDKFLIYKVQDFVMTIAPKLCKEDKIVKFSVTARNEFNFRKSTSFSIQVTKNYNSGSVSIYFPPTWQIVLLTLAFLVFVVGLYFIIRVLCCKKARVVRPSSELFNYEFIEANFDMS